MKQFFSKFGWVACLLFSTLLIGVILSMIFDTAIVLVFLMVYAIIAVLGIVFWLFRRYFINSILICILLVGLILLGYLFGIFNGHINVSFKGIDVKENVTVDGDVKINGGVEVDKNVDVNGNVKVGGNVAVDKDVVIGGNTVVKGEVVVDKNVTVKGNVDVKGGVNVEKDITVNGDINIKGGVNIDKDLNIKDNVNVGKDIVVGGDIITDTPTPVPSVPNPVPSTPAPSVPNPVPSIPAPVVPTPVPATPVPTTPVPTPTPQPVMATANITWGDHIDGATEIFASVVLSAPASANIESNLSCSVVKISDTVYHVRITISEGSHGVAAVSVSGTGITTNQQTKNY